MAAGSVVLTEVNYTSCKKIKFTWTAGTGGEAGTASQATTYAYDGKIIGLTTVPGTAGDQPDDNYGVTITDADGDDVLLGAGLLRDETNTEYVTQTTTAGAAGSILTFNLTAAGSGLKGTATLWIR